LRLLKVIFTMMGLLSHAGGKERSNIKS